MKPLNFMETLFVLKSLGVESVSVDALINAFYKDAAPEPAEEQKEELPEPPKPPGPKVYEDYREAKAAAKKGQATVHDQALGGYVNV